MPGEDVDVDVDGDVNGDDAYVMLVVVHAYVMLVDDAIVHTCTREHWAIPGELDDHDDVDEDVVVDVDIHVDFDVDDSVDEDVDVDGDVGDDGQFDGDVFFMLLVKFMLLTLVDG